MSDEASICSASLDSVFEKIDPPREIENAASTDSSLSVIDLDEVGSIKNLVTIDNVSQLSPTWLTMENYREDSSKTGNDGKPPSVSSIKTDDGNLRPSASSFASPETIAKFVLHSTPAGDIDSDCKVRCDYIEKEDLRSGEWQNGPDEKSHSNEESTKKQAIYQQTFTCEHHLPHDTFIKAAIENSDDLERPEFLPTPIHTREKLDDPALEKNQRTSSYSARSSISETSKDGSVVSSKSGSKEETKKRNERKPLSTLNRPMTSQALKRPNRLAAPRMNAAALSRIQARSPQKQTGNVRSENTFSSLKSSSGMVISSRKVPFKKPVESAKKPLPARNTASFTKQAASKRKIDGSKEAGRSTKVDATSRASHVTPRPATSINARTSSNLRRPQVVSALSRPRATTATAGTRSRSASTKRVSHTKANDQLKNQIGENIDFTNKKNRTLHCALALATLLDYVVNRLDGLSAPQLSSDKEQLQRLLNEQTDKLSSRVDDLEKKLSVSRASHERDVTRYEEEVTHLKAANEATKKDLSQRLEDISAKLLQQTSDHEKTVESLQENHCKAIGDMKTQHDEEIMQLRLAWSEDKAAMERDTLELRQNFDALVEEKVEELIQPYINSYEENKSLRSVLEMKNSEHHKLNLELAQQKEQLKEVHNLRDHVTRLEQRNEDLQTQVEERNSEQRELRNEISSLKRELLEKQRLNKSLQQRVDELDYRLSTSTPSPASPFNPVFTQSPSTSVFGSSTDQSSVSRSTPSRSKFGSRGFREFDSIETPRENGTS